MAVAIAKDQITTNCVGVRYFSWLNPFIDVCVFVPARFLERAREALSKAIDDYWSYEQECYGDCVELRFQNAEIPHVSRYIEWDYEGDDEIIGPGGLDFEKQLSLVGCPIYFVS